MRSPQKPHGISAYIAGREEYEAAWMLLLEKVARARRRGTSWSRGGAGSCRTVESGSSGPGDACAG
jgi:hypothetical protein